IVASISGPPEGNRRATQVAAQSDRSFVESSFERVLGRLPKKDELTVSLEYLQSQKSLYEDTGKLNRFASGPEPSIKPSADPAQRARESFVHVLLNHNDFVTIR